MAITKPKLPSKAGYVEVEVNGQRVYQPTPETAKALKREEEVKELREALNALLGVTTDE